VPPVASLLLDCVCVVVAAPPPVVVVGVAATTTCPTLTVVVAVAGLAGIVSSLLSSQVNITLAIAPLYLAMQ
jgi:hypothetical protein